ncbi:MAG TPA: pentapeptide repeat-containing protein, partial [Polyangium sp.]|nr:pentapeptide repeat-containing protein [Polyangium sp.]
MQGGDDQDDDETAYEAVTTILSRDAVAAAVNAKLASLATSSPRPGIILDEPTMDISDEAIEVYDERKEISGNTITKPFDRASVTNARRPLPSITEKITAPPESMPEPPTIPRRGSVPPPPPSTPTVPKLSEAEPGGPRRGSVPPPPPVPAGVPRPGVSAVPRPASVPPPPPAGAPTQTPMKTIPSRQITAIPGVMPAAVPRPATIPPPPAAPPRPSTTAPPRVNPAPTKVQRSLPAMTAVTPQAAKPATVPIVAHKPDTREPASEPDKPGGPAKPLFERKSTLQGFPSPVAAPKGPFGTMPMKAYPDTNAQAAPDVTPSGTVLVPKERVVPKERTVIMSKNELFPGLGDGSPFAAGHAVSPAIAARRNVEQRIARGESLAGLDLTDADLSELDLSRQSLARSNLCGAILRGARLEGTDLTGVLACETVFTNVRASHAKFDHADLTGATFDGADLAHASFVQAELTGARADGASFV